MNFNLLICWALNNRNSEYRYDTGYDNYGYSMYCTFSSTNKKNGIYTEQYGMQNDKMTNGKWQMEYIYQRQVWYDSGTVAQNKDRTVETQLSVYTIFERNYCFLVYLL